MRTEPLPGDRGSAAPQIVASHRFEDKLRILMLLPFAPDLEGSHGGSRATAALIDSLSTSHRVAVVHLFHEDDPPARRPPRCERIESVRVELAPRPPEPMLTRLARAAGLALWDVPHWTKEAWSPAMEAACARSAKEWQPNIVHFEFHVMSQYIASVRKAVPNAAVVVTEHEPGVVAEFWHDHPMSYRERLRALVARRSWARFENRFLPLADVVVVFTEKDRIALAQLLGTRGPEVSCISLRMPSLLAAPAPTHQAGGLDLLFVGNFRHPPNIDAAERLVRKIFPKVREKLPAARLAIVGAHPPAALANAGAGVNVTGRVDDVAPFVADAAVVMAPLRQGGGMRVKVIEACAAGKAIVGSSCAVEGLGLRDGVEYVRAESDDEFAAAGIDLLSNAHKRRALGEAAYAWAMESQDPGRWVTEYDRLYARLMSKRDDRREVAG